MDIYQIAQIREALNELGAALEELYALARRLDLRIAHPLAFLTWDLDQGIGEVIDQIDLAEGRDRLDQLLSLSHGLGSAGASAPIRVPHCGSLGSPTRCASRQRRRAGRCGALTPT